MMCRVLHDVGDISCAVDVDDLVTGCVRVVGVVYYDPIVFCVCL